MIKSRNNSPIRCAIIGYGYMGEIRRRVIESNPDLELTSICDQDIEKIPKVDNILATSKAQDIVSSIAEAVFVCTPNHLIPNLTVECLDNGKHVFCEKPPGRTVADIDMMRQAEKRNPGAKLMFGFNHRYHPGVMRAKAIIDTGRFGDILTIRGLYGKSGGKNFTKSWRNNPKVSGGGILLDQGIHMLDLFHFSLG